MFQAIPAQYRQKLEHYFIYLLLAFYFSFRLFNLLELPIFNDESIYIDWGWISTHIPNQAFLSLQDAKGPLMMWLFGFFGNFFADPLFAGRFVSVLFGLGSVLGIYFLAKLLFSKQTAYLASILYVITPLYVFYDRQALLESAITCLGIWSCWAFVKTLSTKSFYFPVLLGVLLGLGFLIKSSVLLFFVAIVGVISGLFIKSKDMQLLKKVSIVLGSFFVISLPVITNSFFWDSLPSNSRYAFSLTELFGFPVATWLNSFLAFLEIGNVYLNPFVFIFGFFGIFSLVKKGTLHQKVFIFYYIIALLLQLFSVKGQTTRYLVPFLPFLILLASNSVLHMWKNKVISQIFLGVSLLFSLSMSSFLIAQPVQFIQSFPSFVRYTHSEYIRGQTSGVGIREIMDYLREKNANESVALVLVAFNAGNPENAVDVFAQYSKNLVPSNIDSRMFQGLEQYDCLTSAYPLYLVTRVQQRMGLDKYVELEKTFPNPDGIYSLNIYHLKKDCKGNKAQISDVYEPYIRNTLNRRIGL